MKLYKGLVAAVVEALESIFIQNRQADRVVEQLLKSNKKWGARDRAFIAENTYELVRWWRLARFSAGLEQITSSPEIWKVTGSWLIIKNLHLNASEADTLPDWPEWEGIDSVKVLSRYWEGMQIRKIAQSIPDWLDAIGSQELGKAWEAELTALNKQAPVVLRANRLKTNPEALIELFGADEAERLSLPDAVILKKRQHILKTEAYQSGLLEVQDAGSQLIAPYLDIRPGMSVIDACAGAGGKTLHIGALLGNTGSILAMDLDAFKLAELEKRAVRNGVTNIQSMRITGDDIIQGLSETADRLLLDVPCSGLGVLRRNPDSKWKLKPTFLDQIRTVQWKILSAYSRMVKKGGKMVYATCSILPSESDHQVARFMKEFGSSWTFISEQRTSPARDGYDGFYMALMERKQ